MSYLIFNAKSKKQEVPIKKFADKMKLEYKSVSLEQYVEDIKTSRQQIKAGKKIALKDLVSGI